MGYRIDITKGVAKGNEPETLCKRTAPVFRRLLLRRKPQQKRCADAVFGGKHYNGGCCFDYGNAESNNLDTGAGSMEAIYFGNSHGWGHGAGKGPWIMADLENGTAALSSSCFWKSCSCSCTCSAPAPLLLLLLLLLLLPLLALSWARLHSACCSQVSGRATRRRWTRSRSTRRTSPRW